ncbi:MAG: P-type conjugative transfer protein TrbG [Alphaproteobacteria bacterium 65-7]|nr:MAG: P-type conjugative transfer protein TrbG [Alphaproteobacteria bacterium 65-7]
MHAVTRAAFFVPLTISLSACAWMPSFLRNDPPQLQAAQLQEEPVPRIIPAAFVQSLPVSTVVAVPTLPVAAPPKAKSKTPAQRVAAANTSALQEPTTDGYINANQVYNYSDGAIYRLYAAPQMVSDIALEPGENLTAISAGDTTRWVVGDTTSGSGPTKRVHVLAKPFAAGLKTNLVITTDRRSYHLELQSTRETFMAALSWTYPQDNLVKQAAAAAAPVSPLDTLPALDKLNFNYSIAGDNVAWKPVRAFDDGTRVFIEFPNALTKGEAPPLFVSGANGGQDLVNYRVRGTYYVVDQLFTQAELRAGQDRQQVVKIKRTAPTRTAQAR